MANRKKIKSIEDRLQSVGIRKIDGIYYVPEEVFFRMCDKAELIKMEFDNFPSVRDIKTANVEKNIGKYLPFLLYLDTNEVKGYRQKETNKYINELVKKYVVVV